MAVTELVPTYYHLFKLPVVDKVTKRGKMKDLRYRLHKTFVCIKLDEVLVQIAIMQEVSLKRVE